MKSCLPSKFAVALRTKLMFAMMFFLVVVVVAPGCSGRKKAEQALQEQRDKSIQEALKSLKALMTDNGMTVEQKRAEWNRIKNLNLNQLKEEYF